MYIQITSKCSFACSHCMFSCRPGRGEHMSMDTVKAAGRFCQDIDSDFFIGGGEPTMHPNFWEIVGLVMKYNAQWAYSNGCPPVQLVTNGSQTDTALALAALARTEAAYVRLSRDQYHLRYKIDPRVVSAFERKSSGSHDVNNCAVGTHMYNVVPVGRALRTGEWTMSRTRGCSSCGPMVTPDGTIWRCECRKEKIGTVFEPMKFDGDLLYEDAGCTKIEGKLILDPVLGILRTRKTMESEGWVFNRKLGIMEKKNGTIDSTSAKGTTTVDNSPADASDVQPLSAGIAVDAAGVPEGGAVCQAGCVGT